MSMNLRRFGALCLVSAAALVPGCGRGPVEPPPLIATIPTIEFQVWVSGQITPSQGNYIIAINTNLNPSTNVNAGLGETPGEPTAAEGQGSPATFTHWDQNIQYGSSTSALVNGFAYQYKLLTGSTGSTTVRFFPIVLNTNDFILIPNGSAGSGIGNVLSITLPLEDISIRGNPASSTPPTITSPKVTQIYVNYITTDTSNIPQDQLGANGLGTIGYTQIVDITKAGTTQLPNFSSASGPSNPNLFLIGGQITVKP
jgi:hypothetical protein